MAWVHNLETHKIAGYTITRDPAMTPRQVVSRAITNVSEQYLRRLGKLAGLQGDSR